MPAKNKDLHGNAPDQSTVALLLIDVINDLEFDGGEDTLEHAVPMARATAELKKKAKAAGIPAVYVNDNYGRWQSNFDKTVEHVRDGGVRGRPLAEILAPEEDDYFVLKPKHSGFFSTTLDTLLDYLGARTLILTGIAADICVLFTANDAYMRDFLLVVPEDCVASRSPEATGRALDLMRTGLKADTTPSTELDFEGLKRMGADRPGGKE
jgi:nicotinamidase-related amidase